MAMVSRGKKRSRRLQGEDHISRLPDPILVDIISLLPTKDATRTQVFASPWRHLWRSAPLDLQDNRPPMQGRDRDIRVGELSGILSSHPGPGRRLSIPMSYFDDDKDPAATLDRWLRSPALDSLQELEFHYGSMFSWLRPLPPVPASAHRFSSTLRVASFGGCGFPDGKNASALRLPLLKHLSLMNVRISERSLHALLAGCPVLQSLMLTESIGPEPSECRIRLVSSTLRSIGVQCSDGGKNKLEQLIIEDAPCLERLLLFGQDFREQMVISVISAPKLEIFGQLPVLNPRLEFGATVFQGSRVVNSTVVVPSVKVLALTHKKLSLDLVIDFMKCFPCLENLYIKINESTMSTPTNAWCHKYRNLISTLDICLKNIVLTTYRGNKAHVNFAKFFVLNATVLESMVLQVHPKNDNKAWIEKQHTLLQIDNRASRFARFDIFHHFGRPMTLEYIWSEQVHDLSTADPFIRFDSWA